MGAQQPVNNETLDFLNMIYSGEEGYIYLALKIPNTTTFRQQFYAWPGERDQALSFIEEHSKDYEVYYGPSLFSEKSAKKEHVKGARVVWCEFDGAIPEDLGPIPEPHIRVKSSSTGHEHWYWRLDTFLEVETLEGINRKLAYSLDADTSGWDANQVLRPINTRNHKRGKDVNLLAIETGSVSPDSFTRLPEPPPPVDAPIPDEIPPVEDVISRYKFTETIWDLFKHGMPEGKRSEALMSLGYYLAELQLHNDEVFSMLLNADERWGKFSGRSDQYKRLMEIVVRARIKYPYKGVTLEEGPLESMGFLSLLKTEVKIEWVMEGLLHKSGYMLVTGPSGVGKSQFSLNAAARIVLAQNFLGRDVHTTHEKIGFFSLEMGIEEVKQFLEMQGNAYTKEEKEILEERLRIFPLGEPIYLTTESERKRIEETIIREKLTGVMFDSMGSVTEKSLSNEENVKILMDWNDSIRKRLGIFTWFIHHHRKGNGDNRTPNSMSDIYGNQYITARTTSIIVLWPTGKSGTLKVIPVKTRLIAKPKPFYIYRNSHLQFEVKNGILTDPGEDKTLKGTPRPKQDRDEDSDPDEDVKFSF